MNGCGGIEWPGGVIMGVDETRHRHAAAEIDDLGTLAGHSFDIGYRTNNDECTILDCDRLSPGLSFVDRVDATVCVHRIGDCARLAVAVGAAGSSPPVQSVASSAVITKDIAVFMIETTFIFSPKGDGSIKWGIGPQVSIKTHTSDRVAGPGWGGGVVAVIFGGAGNWALGAIGMQHWGEDDYSVGTLQLTALYNFESTPGMYLGYNNAMTFNWEASSGDKVTVPLGATFGRTLPLSGGAGIDLSVGAYRLVERPTNAPEWQLKFGISYFFP